MGTLESWLTHLRSVVPPTGVTLVGAGSGRSPWIQWLKLAAIEEVTLVEADEIVCERLKLSTQDQPGWQVRQQVVGPRSGEVIFHDASIGSESALLEPERLRGVWPNIISHRKQAREAITLSDLLSQSDVLNNWLILDCLPAGALLEGAVEQMESIDLLLVRGLLGAETAVDTQSSLAALREFIEGRGFRYLSTEAERHPNLGHALWIRDRQFVANGTIKEVALLKQQHAELSAQLEAAAALIDSLRGELELMRNSSTELELVRQELARERAAREGLATQLSEQLRGHVHTAAALQQASEERDRERASVETKTDELAELRRRYEAESRIRSKQAEEYLELARQHGAQSNLLQSVRAEKTGLERELTEARTSLLETAASRKTCEQQVAALEQQHKLLSGQLEEALKSEEGHAAEAQILRTETLEQLAGINRMLAQAAQGWTAATKPLTDQMEALQASLQEARATSAEKDRLADEHAERVAEALDRLSGEQKKLLTEAESRLRADFGKKSANAVRQIEAYLEIQKYLETGRTLPSFHGWPISPDLGSFLLRKIQERRYDLIIEFGSGSSTVLFSMALNEQVDGAIGSDEKDVRPSARRIIAFEHNTKYVERTSRLLSTSGGSGLVDLVYSPLIDWQDSESRYLYYDCESMLARVEAGLVGRRARILVLVDGPPGDTCANSRYPAVPLIFGKLGRHEVDIVLDDADRPQERTVIDLWRRFWKQRSFHIHEEFIESEKGIYFASSCNE